MCQSQTFEFQKHDLINDSVFNCRSVRNNTDFLRDMIIENKLNIIGFTETWLKTDEKHIIGQIVPDGHLTTVYQDQRALVVDYF